MTTKQLIEQYELALQNVDSHIENALLDLLLSNQEQITGLVEDDPDRFHKYFRIIDVCESRGNDHAIWHLLHEVKIFWEVFEKLNK